MRLPSIYLPLLVLAACSGERGNTSQPMTGGAVPAAGPHAAGAEEAAGASEAARVERVERTEEQWRELLSAEQYHVLREKGTELGGTGEYEHTETAGTYLCAGCGLELFGSQTKFHSGTGWPSFWAPITALNVTEQTDRSLGMVRTEVLCAACGGHLGHVFPNDSVPTGLRYCINSAALRLEPGEE